MSSATDAAAATLAEVRGLVAAGRLHRAHATVADLRHRDGARELGRVAAGVVAAARGYAELAWAELGGVRPETWARLAPAETLRSGLTVAPDQALDAVRRLLAEQPPGVAGEQWYEVVAALFGAGAHELAREAFAVFERHADGWDDGPRQRDWLRPWIAADPASPSAPAPPAGRPVLAIMDYGHPGARRASANLGDHIQSIASLAHLVRHEGVRLHGPEELVGFLSELRGRTRPEARRDDLDADLEVMTVHRDASMYQPIPEGAWVLCFGWYMHALFELRHGFPLHRGLRPVFISFHCNKRSLLTREAVAYLRRYGPVGCRDWPTVHLLASAGVPSFFSGCLTTTIGLVFPDAPPPPPEAPPAYVDVPAVDVPPGGIVYGHSSQAVRERSFTVNARIALDRLDAYRREHPLVVTSRLHCHLPLRSIGVPTEFRPLNPADLRFDGLTGITDAAFGAIRSGLEETLEPVLRAIVSGAGEDEVYGVWRELTAADVAAAAQERRRPVAVAPGPSWGRRLQRARKRTVTRNPCGGAVHCAVLPGRTGVRGLPVLLDSLSEHASRRLHVWIVGATPGDAQLERRFPELTLSWIPGRPLRRRGRRLRRVLLPELLADVDRAVVLPLPAAATADVAELAELDLEEHALGAARRPGTARVSGFGVVHTAANRLRDQPLVAAELRRLALTRHAFDFDAFDADVLVMDLARLRRERFSEEGLALARHFGLSDVEALHLIVGPDRAEVPARWAVVPTRTPERGPGLLHWTDGLRPWRSPLTPGWELWERHALAR